MPNMIELEGWREFQTALRKADKDLPKMLRVGLNEVVGIVAEAARPQVPRLSGRAAASIKPQSTQRVGQVKAGGAKASYYPWLDFGGAVGRNRSVRRPFITSGRYLYPAFSAKRPEIDAKLLEVMVNVAASAGLKVS